MPNSEPVSRIPFPGMRPFRREDSAFFFGQETQVEAVLDRLGQSRFVAVLGESGCGKSSLVRAGVTPALVGADPAWSAALWTVVTVEPKNRPVARLAEGLAAVGGRPPDEIEEELRSTAEGLADVCAGFGAEKNTLLIVDQFEELFGFRRMSNDSLKLAQENEAALFVKLLLRAARSEASAIYIILTMRSEYLADCTLVPSLAEAINEGAFLLPRMTRYQCEHAILEPLKLAGAGVEHALLQQLLFEASTSDQDALPLLQHSLRRLFENWRTRGASGNLEFRDFSVAGDGTKRWMGRQLNHDLEKIWEELGSDQEAAASVFQLLGEYDHRGNAVRIPASFEDIERRLGDRESLKRILKTFSDESRARYFLKVGGGLVELPHEVLLRCWERLKNYINDEARAGKFLKELWDRVSRPKRSLLRSGDLQEGRKLVREHPRFLEWASRYIAKPDSVRSYIQRSQWVHRAKLIALTAVSAGALAAGGWYFDTAYFNPIGEKNAALQAEAESIKACAEMVGSGFRPIAVSRDLRFLGKVQVSEIVCRGGTIAEQFAATPWVDWANYWGTGDASSSPRGLTTRAGALTPSERGVLGALLDLEYGRVELMKFNLFDDSGTYREFIQGRNGVAGNALKTWREMRVPAGHPDLAAVATVSDGTQTCKADAIRGRTVDGVCNDIFNPLMGSTGMVLARNTEFEATFPELGRTDLTRNRHGNRIGLLKPDPQLISRKLFTRQQSNPGKCNDGYGLPGFSKDADCDYAKAPFLNVLAAFWIQFMANDWFSHIDEGHNAQQDIRSDVAQSSEPGKFNDGAGKQYLDRAPKTFRNNVTAWWDASQIYGYDVRSRQRVKRDPKDPAKLLLVAERADDRQGYLPTLAAADPMLPEWAGQEAVSFPDNFNIGMSFYHNVFSREHNAFVGEFRKQAAATPEADSGLRNPAQPERVIRYREVTPDELFEAARLVIAAEIAKIHTTEWTTQLLYNEPLYRIMNAQWNGLRGESAQGVSDALQQVVTKGLGASLNAQNSGQWFSVFASGPGIFGLGNRISAGGRDLWSLTNPQHVNGGVNHFGSPFSIPEELVTVSRLHAMLPDLIELRQWNNDPNRIRNKYPVVGTYRSGSVGAMHSQGIANWALSMGRQRVGVAALQNHPRFLQNLKIAGPQSPTQQMDVAAADLIRGREHGVPRYNEFRRQVGLRQLTSFDNFIDQHLTQESPERRHQEDLVRDLREIYGQHMCDASMIITDAQRNADGTPINDCLGHPNRAPVDNVEDVDTAVGVLAESTRPHGFAISETQFVVFVLNVARGLYSDRFFTSSFRPEFYTRLGVDWVNNNGPGPEQMEKSKHNGHDQPVSPLKRVLLRTIPELGPELSSVINVFDPWARDRGDYYSLVWRPRAGAESDEAFRK